MMDRRSALLGAMTLMTLSGCRLFESSNEFSAPWPRWVDPLVLRDLAAKSSSDAIVTVAEIRDPKAPIEGLNKRVVLSPIADGSMAVQSKRLALRAAGDGVQLIEDYADAPRLHLGIANVQGLRRLVESGVVIDVRSNPNTGTTPSASVAG